MFDVQQAGNDPVTTLPANWAGQRIALKMTGGIGDAVMSIGASARRLKDIHQCFVTAVVMPHQVPLMERFSGIDAVHPVTYLNNPQNRQKYDVVIDFYGTFNNRKQLKPRPYYDLVSERLSLAIERPGYFRNENPRFNPNTVAIHPGASNPNRRWHGWSDLAINLIWRGYAVTFVQNFIHKGLTTVSHHF